MYSFSFLLPSSTITNVSASANTPLMSTSSESSGLLGLNSKSFVARTSDGWGGAFAAVCDEAIAPFVESASSDLENKLK